MRCLGLAILAAGMTCCEFANDESRAPALPIGLFRTRSEINMSYVDSSGFATHWVDTGEYSIRIGQNGKWEQFGSVQDTCVFWKSTADYAFAADTIFLTHIHGINYKIESPKCLEISYEYDVDSTGKAQVIGYSEAYLEIATGPGYPTNSMRYDRVVAP